VSFREALGKKFWSEDRLKGTTAYAKANLPSLTAHSLPRFVKRSRWPGTPHILYSKLNVIRVVAKKRCG
jgi:hypothetical protein